MEFLKKHYEKIVLGVVLVGLVGSLVFLPFYIDADKAKMAALIDLVVNPHVSALPDLNLSAQTAIATRLQAPYNLDFETTNKLFNPLEWQKTPDGHIIKISTGNEVGIHAAVVTNIAPLYLVLTLDSVATNELGARYVIGIEKQAAAALSKRRKTQRYVSVGDKPNDTFALVQVKGAPENPDALVLKLLDSGELVTLPHDKPFRRVDAYTADFRYDPEKKVFHGLRAVGSPSETNVSFGGTDYVVVDVNKNELILADQSNQKKTSLPFSP